MFTQNADIVWDVIAALLIDNFLLLILNSSLVGIFVKLLSVPPMYLLPIILGLILPYIIGLILHRRVKVAPDSGGPESD